MNSRRQNLKEHDFGWAVFLCSLLGCTAKTTCPTVVPLITNTRDSNAIRSSSRQTSDESKELPPFRPELVVSDTLNRICRGDGEHGVVCVDGSTGTRWTHDVKLAAFDVSGNGAYCGISTTRDVVRWVHPENGKDSLVVIGQVRGNRYSLTGDAYGGCCWSDRSGTRCVALDGSERRFPEELESLQHANGTVCGRSERLGIQCLSDESELRSVSSSIGTMNWRNGGTAVCGTDQFGRVRCIGGGANWLLGNGSNLRIFNLSFVRDATLVNGDFYTCAHNETLGRAWCWGRGPVAIALGALGGAVKELPVRGLGEIDAQPNFLCFRTAFGDRACLGDPTHETTSLERVAQSRAKPRCVLTSGALDCPATADGPAFLVNDVVSATTARNYGCAKKSSGDVMCWSGASLPQKIDALYGTPSLRETHVGEICGSRASITLILQRNRSLADFALARIDKRRGL